MLSKYLVDEITIKHPDRLRDDANAAIAKLRSMGVDPLSDFGTFYSTFKGRFPTPSGKLELLELLGPGIPTIPDQMEYIQDRYEIPVGYIPITSDEGEGMYLYEINSESIYDYYLGSHEQFMSGKYNANWTDFQTFLEWYFDLSEPGVHDINQ